MNKTHPIDKNVLGTPLVITGTDPLTGFYRDGFCCTGPQDTGKHVIAAVVTDAFLEFTLALGNNLISPYPASNFPGLKAGDRWCLCALRWKEAFDFGFAPPVILEATHENALLYITLEDLKANEFKS
ncbi:DUF2237 family protein [Pedobacter alpinus]|uniref:DUF2237 family protein n=1 Tax=Pedobacter alpinus TaxID=1590643 RepID=A0ABW5TX86_9SPHI